MTRVGGAVDPGHDDAVGTEVEDGLDDRRIEVWHPDEGLHPASAGGEERPAEALEAPGPVLHVEDDCVEPGGTDEVGDDG